MFHYQLKTLLIDEILAGTYGSDGKVPTEQALCQRFGLSRTPVTRALSELAISGELEPGIALGRAADRIAAITGLPLIPADTRK